MLKTISNIVAVTIGSAASVLFIVLFSQTVSSAVDAAVISFPLLILLIGGIMLLICGVVGLLSANRVIFLVCSLLSLAALLAGLIFTENKLIFALLNLALLFAMVSNLIYPSKRPFKK